MVNNKHELLLALVDSIFISESKKTKSKTNEKMQSQRNNIVPKSTRVLRSQAKYQKENIFRAKRVKVVIKLLSIDELNELTKSIEFPSTLHNKAAVIRKELDSTKQVQNKCTKSAIGEFISQSSQKIWSQLIAGGSKVHINDIVCARMLGFKPWPARVVNIYPKSKGIEAAWVEFFGTFQIGEVLRSNCIPFDSCRDLLLSYCKGKQKGFVPLNTLDENREIFISKLTKKQQFIQAIRDAEIYVKFPIEFSILNKIDFE